MTEPDCSHRRAFTTDKEWWCPDCEDYEELNPSTHLVTIGEELF